MRDGSFKGGKMRAGVVAGLLLAALAACGGGDRLEDDAEAESGAGGPPRQQHTPAALPDSNPLAAADSTARPDTAVGITIHQVHNGPHGMSAQVRWTFSPDQRAVLVVEDPVGVEAEPVPDGFLYASEVTGAVVQVDGVWDVVPSPDWRRLAYGRAFVFRTGEADSIPAREWDRLLGWLPEDVAERSTAALRRRLARYVFPVSGMSAAKGFALTQVLTLDSLWSGRLPVVRAPTARTEGWRFRWTRNADTLAVGSAPQMVQDDAPATRWTLVRTLPVRSYHDSIGVATPAMRFADVSWITGPTIDLSVPFEMARERHVPALGATVTSRDGVIKVERKGTVTEVGPGAALGATHNGRFIIAVVAHPAPREIDPKVRVVVYELPP